MIAMGPALATTPSNALVMAWNIDAINTFDPAQSTDVVSNEIIANLCDTLVSPDPDDQTRVQPALAQRWDFDEARRTLTFHLRPGLQFAPGRPATAQDLVWSIRRSLTLGMGGATALKEYGFSADNIDTAIVALDAQTLRVQLAAPYPLAVFLQAFAAHRLTSLLDRETLLAHEVEGDLGNRYLARHSACVGPLYVRQWNAGEVIVLERNEQGTSAPALKRVIIRHVAESATQRLLLEKGDIDIARNLNAQDLTLLEGKPGVRIEVMPRPQLYFLNINNEQPPLNNPKVRLALRYLFDYQGLADTVMRYSGVPRASFVPLGTFGALGAAEGQPFRLDLDKARQLLAEAGYPQGFEIKLTYGTPLFSAPIAQSLQRNAALVGVRMQLERMTNGQLFSRLTARQYQLSLHSLDSNIADAHGMASRLVFNPSPTPRQARGAVPSIFASYHWAPANQAVEAALFEHDPALRAARYQQLQRQQMEEGPFAYLFQLNSIAALRDNVRQWRWNGLRTYFAGVHK